jgi:hypothetical protein
MTKPSRVLLNLTTVALALSGAGLVLGMLYNMYVVFIRRAQLETVLAASIYYYKTVGALGILGMVLFFAFLLSLMASRENKTNDRKR